MIFGIVGCETTSSLYQPNPQYKGDAFRHNDLYERYVIPKMQIILEELISFIFIHSFNIFFNVISTLLIFKDV